MYLSVSQRETPDPVINNSQAVDWRFRKSMSFNKDIDKSGQYLQHKSLLDLPVSI